MWWAILGSLLPSILLTALFCLSLIWIAGLSNVLLAIMSVQFDKAAIFEVKHKGRVIGTYETRQEAKYEAVKYMTPLVKEIAKDCLLFDNGEIVEIVMVAK